MESYAFIHFGINTFTNAEWGSGGESPELFNPTDFNADQIVESIKAAGFKGLILTCKHHDGFCLWPTKTTSHSIAASPYAKGKGDIVKAISEACKRHGVRFGIYLSPWDRNAASYGSPEYIALYREQLTELLTQYGPIFEIWFDGANGGLGFYGGANENRNVDRLTYYHWPETWELVRKLQPQAVIFSDIGPGCRWVGNEKGRANYPCWATFTPRGLDGNPAGIGSCDTSENQSGTPNGKFWIPAECDVSIRPGWFWHPEQNDQVRIPENLLNLYFQSVGHGGSFLLNIPPDTRGQVHENDVKSLRTFGAMQRALFSNNLAHKATATADCVRENAQDFAPSKVLDGDCDTYWATNDDVHSATLTLELEGEKTFDVIRLREPIALGQRIRAFTVEARIGGGVWKPWIQDGSSIGAQTLLRREAISADAIRIHISKADACPLLSEVSLWKLPASQP